LTIIGKPLHSGYLMLSHSCHAVLESIVTTEKRWVYHNNPETETASM